MKKYEFTPFNPRYLLWMLVTNQTSVSDDNNADYQSWINSKWKIFDDLLDLYDEDERVDGKNFGEWLIYTVRNDLTSERPESVA